MSLLRRKLAVVLWQLPPRWNANLERLDAFLAALPRRSRHAVEFRDESWYDPAVCDVLDRHLAAFCEHDLVRLRPPRLSPAASATPLPRPAPASTRDATAPRRSPPVARDLARFAREGDAFVYFNNDVGGHAVHDARDLVAMLPEVVRMDDAAGAAARQ